MNCGLFSHRNWSALKTFDQNETVYILKKDINKYHIAETVQERGWSKMEYKPSKSLDMYYLYFVH